MKRSLLIYDALGAAIVLGSLGMGLYNGLTGHGIASQRLADLRREHSEATRQLDSARQRLKLTASQLEQVRREVQQRGSLPAQSATESDLRRISQLAREHAVQLVDVAPASARVYTGLVEVRYNMRAKGTYPALIRWLRALEQEPFWADITRLSLSAARRTNDEENPRRMAELTVSLYSSQAEDGETG